MHLNFSFRFWEILDFFPKTLGHLGAPGGATGAPGAPPEGVPHMSTFQQSFEYSTFLEYIRIIIQA